MYSYSDDTHDIVVELLLHNKVVPVTMLSAVATKHSKTC